MRSVSARPAAVPAIPTTSSSTTPAFCTSTVAGSGINTYTGGDYADISITNDANITAGNQGIVATTLGYDSDIDIDIDTEGNITAGSTAINTYTRSSFSDIDITNDGKLMSYTGQGIVATTLGYDSDIDIDTEGNITAGSTAINTYTRELLSSDIDITNDGKLMSSGGEGILANTRGPDSNITIDTRGDITAAGNGINAYATGNRSKIAIENRGDIDAGFHGIIAETQGDATDPGISNGIDIQNWGDINSTNEFGIIATTRGDATAEYSDAGIVIGNRGDIASLGNSIHARTLWRRRCPVQQRRHRHHQSGGVSASRPVTASTR